MVIYADGFTLEQIKVYGDMVAGFTTNPTLLFKAGIKDYAGFAREALSLTDKPFSFEVLSDDFSEMKRQALLISKWGNNVNVKIPITNSEGKSSIPLIAELINEGIKVNITAVTTIKQVVELFSISYDAKGCYLSVFAGRIADTGIDPVPIMEKVVYLIGETPVKLIWASAREAFNVVQAERAKCDIITLSFDLFKKYLNFGKPLPEVSLDTVKMFINDGKNFTL